MSKVTHEEPEERPEHLEQIRDIIFGPQKREFESRLFRLEEKLAEMKSSLAYSMDELTRALTLELRSTAQSFESKLKALADQTGQDREGTRRQIEQMESRFDKSLQHTIQTAAEKITSLDLTLKAEDNRLQQELSLLREQVYRDLDSRSTELADSKVSRDMMAEALIELGMKVKAGERLSELKLISQKKLNQ